MKDPVYSYDGNNDENYTLYKDGISVCNLLLGEDAVIDVVCFLNQDSSLEIKEAVEFALAELEGQYNVDHNFIIYL